MALFWTSGFASNNSNLNNGFLAIANLGLAERMRRVIVRWQVVVQPQDQTIRSTVYRAGVIALIESTAGSPPPFPAPIENGLFGSRDIVASDWQNMGAEDVLLGILPIPGDSRAGEFDIQVSRGDGIQPHTIWWNFGLAPTESVGVNVLFDRIWWRVLIEQV